MDVLVPAERLQGRRLKELKLVAETFMEERAIHAIFEVIQKGGRIITEPKEESYPPVIYEFPGISREV